MKIKKLSLALLLFTWTSLSVIAQKTNNFNVEVELSVLGSDHSTDLNPRFIFPNLKPNQLSQLNEIYIEFELQAEITSGNKWPYFYLHVDCLESGFIEYTIGRLSGLNSESGATHYLRIYNPVYYLQYNAVEKFYFFDLQEGFCANPPHEMIGYVDVILNASDPGEASGQTSSFDYCSNIFINLNQVIFKETNSEEAATSLGTDQLVFGPECQRVGNDLRQSPDDESDKLSEEEVLNSQALIYPNPATTYFFIEQPPRSTDSTLALYTADGRLVKKQNNKHSKMKWPVHNLSKGIYWLQITNKDQTTIHKIMIAGSK